MEAAPQIGPGDDFWYLAFSILGSERPPAFSGVAQIPFSAILKFAEYYDLSEFETDFLIEFIRGVDEWHIARILKKQASQSKTK